MLLTGLEELHLHYDSCDDYINAIPLTALKFIARLGYRVKPQGGLSATSLLVTGTGGL